MAGLTDLSGASIPTDQDHGLVRDPPDVIVLAPDLSRPARDPRPEDVEEVEPVEDDVIALCGMVADGGEAGVTAAIAVMMTEAGVGVEDVEVVVVDEVGDNGL